MLPAIALFAQVLSATAKSTAHQRTRLVSSITRSLIPLPPVLRTMFPPMVNEPRVCTSGFGTTSTQMPRSYVFVPAPVTVFWIRLPVMFAPPLMARTTMASLSTRLLTVLFLTFRFIVDDSRATR